MRKGREGERVSQLGDFWLSHDPKSPEIWCITWYDAAKRQTRRRSTGLSDLEAAKLKLAEWVVLNTSLKDERPEDVQLCVILDRYYEHHGRIVASADAIARAVELWQQFWGDASIADLSLTRQNEFEQWLRGQTYTRGKSTEPIPYSGGYVARVWNVGPTALEWARASHEIKWYPDVRYLSDGKTRDRVLTLEEAAALIDGAAQSEHTWRWVLLAFGTAARPSAILDITSQSEQVDLERRLLNLLPPGARQIVKKRRPIVPIVPTLLPWLRQWMAPESLVYRATRKGRSRVRLSHLITFHGKRIRKARGTFETIKERSGLTDPLITSYTIRHTVSTWMAERGVSEREHEIWMGHRMPGSATTGRYIHLKPDYLRNAAAAVEELLVAVAPLVKVRQIRTGPVSTQHKG